MDEEQRSDLVRIGIALALFASGWFLPGWWRVGVFLAAWLTAGYGVLWASAKNILKGEIFDENFLMAVASIGALILGDVAEGAAVMLFYQVGEWFQEFASGRARRSIAALMDIRPDVAHVLRGGKPLDVAPEEVAVGEALVVRPGERVPLDGTLVQGETTLDLAALTGESLPQSAAPGAAIPGGAVNLTGLIELRVERAYGESTVARILTLVERAAERKARTEAFITRFARVYTPIVCLSAVGLAVVPPLVAGDWAMWAYRALSFLVISCPCALVISVPLSFFGGIGAASRCGILLKGSGAIEALARVRTVVFDKTGTLTQGRFSVASVVPAPGFEREGLLTLAATAEAASSHPLARAIVAAAPAPQTAAENLQEIAGQGVCARVAGQEILVGGARLLETHGVAFPEGSGADGTCVLMAVDGRYAGAIVLRDEPKPDAAQAVRDLRRAGVRQVAMLTGDGPEAAERTARALAIDRVFAKLLPADKVSHLERIQAESRGRDPSARVAFVGDGINDAPVLALADVGVAMGGVGSDAAIEAADAVLMDDRPAKLPLAIRIARGTMAIAWQNIVFAIGVKVAILVLGALGITGLWWAVFADVGVAFLAVLNALRALLLRR